MKCYFLLLFFFSPLFDSNNTHWLINECPNETCGTGTVATFACDPEYFLTGYSSIFCVGCGEWELPFPMCKTLCIATSKNLEKNECKKQKGSGCFYMTKFFLVQFKKIH